MSFKLGLQPPRPGAVKLRLATYINWRELPVPNGDFGHSELVSDWGMLGNDQWGDCALAGPAHQTMLWTAEAGAQAPFTDACVLQNYSDVTGFDPNAGPSGENPTDQGTDVGQMAAFWRNTGMLDANGQRHKIVAYVDLTPGDLRELWAATYLFQSVGLGFALPESAQDQFANGQPWDVVRGSKVVGGHYVPAVGRAGGNGIGVTWGKSQPFTPAFYRKYNNQGIVAFSEEMLINARSIDGFDDQLLRSDLGAFG
ncbi:hypothetical protein OS122_02435 [Mycolicibacterium mucogenicum]|uniref:hypothetical protein n=1 Tax=Mycolicibacterium mucogenicum TaxID=56689 RepID=UPI00226A11AE|nr:hypothetical protein [Mycolicibacterium mucogenicum]MCX8559756.1 hypothetical protein [Mycolicibacterium mucogenicum]